MNANLPIHKANIIAIAEVIRESQKTLLGGIPSGHLYAVLMAKIDLDIFNFYIKTLVDIGLVEQSNYLLTWKDQTDIQTY